MIKKLRILTLCKNHHTHIKLKEAKHKMTPERIVETYLSVQKVHDEYYKFGIRISWFVLETTLVSILLRPSFDVTSVILAGMTLLTLIMSLSIRHANKEQYKKIHSVSSSGFVMRCLQYKIIEGPIHKEDAENINQLKISAVKYLRLTRLDIIASMFSIVFCLAFLIVAIIQMLV